MTTPTEKWRSRENPYNVLLTVDIVEELYHYAVQLEDRNTALSVNAENLEIVRKQRDEGANLARAYTYAYEDALNGWVDSVKETDEARDIACKLLALAKTLWRARFPIRGMAAVEWMNLPEWLRREIEG